MEKIPEPRSPHEFILDAFADPASVRDVVRGILHTIFFHRYFPTITPQTHEVLDLTLPYVAVPDLETLIDARTASLVRELDSSSSNAAAAAATAAATIASPTTPTSPGPFESAKSSPYSSPQPGRAAAAIGAFLGVGGGGSHGSSPATAGVARGGGRGQISVQFMEKTRRRKMWYKGDEEVCWESWTIRVTVAEPRTESERAKVRKAMESTLLTTIMKIITSVNTYKDHIPPITTTEANPFPYSITVNQKESGGLGAGGGGGGGGWAGRFAGMY